MLLRFVFAFVCTVAMLSAQTEAPAPQGATAKVTLPPAASEPQPVDAAAAQSAPAPSAVSTQTAPKPAPSADTAQAAPKSDADSGATEQRKPNPAPASAKTGSAKSEKTAAPGHKPYVFGALDIILIKVYKQPELSGPFSISPDGFISIPVVGDVKADGLTATELRDEITKRLKDCCINNPEGEVDVSLGKNNSKRFFVIGGVGRPGQYPLDRDDLTVMEALSDVGGLHEFAKKKKIRIQRQGNPKEFLFNYVEVSRGKNMKQDIVIQNGDRIFVDE